MKRIITIVALAALLLSCGDSKPIRQFVFINTAAETRVIAFEAKKDDGSFEDGYKVYETVGPKAVAYAPVPEGLYRIQVFIDKGEEMDLQFSVEDHRVKLSGDQDSIYSDYSWIDLAGDFRYALVDLNSLYEGSAAQAGFRESLGMAGGDFVREVFVQASPFSPKIRGQLKIVAPFEGTPDEISVGTRIFGLAPFSRELKAEDEIMDAIIDSTEKYFVD